MAEQEKIAVRTCSRCGQHQVPANRAACPYCGHIDKLPTPAPPPKTPKPPS